MSEIRRVILIKGELPHLELIQNRKIKSILNEGLQDHFLRWRAIFACLIRVRSSEELENFKWGWNRGKLLEEALERQRFFIESQHFPCEPGDDEPNERRTLSLRCICNPRTSKIKLVLVAKISAETVDMAHQAGIQYWNEIKSVFPYDYELIPAKSRDEFKNLIGWKVFEAIGKQDTIAEIQRFQGVVSTGQKYFYVLGSWSPSVFANEQIWRVLANANEDIMLDVMLQPTVLGEDELATLELTSQNAKEIADHNDIVTVHPYAQFAAEYYKQLLENLRRPYILRVCLVAPNGVPKYIPRTIGFAFSHRNERGTAVPSFRVISLKKSVEIDRLRDQIFWLEPDLSSNQVVDERFRRLHRMCDIHEAHTLFRLPYPPGPGLPGVSFVEEIG